MVICCVAHRFASNTASQAIGEFVVCLQIFNRWFRVGFSGDCMMVPAARCQLHVCCFLSVKMLHYRFAFNRSSGQNLVAFRAVFSVVQPKSFASPPSLLLLLIINLSAIVSCVHIACFVQIQPLKVRHESAQAIALVASAPLANRFTIKTATRPAQRLRN